MWISVDHYVTFQPTSLKGFLQMYLLGIMPSQFKEHQVQSDLGICYKPSVGTGVCPGIIIN